MILQAPGPGLQFQTLGFGTFTSDAYGVVSNPPTGALASLFADGCVPMAYHPGANFRNLLDGGDFTVNPWQRGTTFTAISSTAKYTADRFAAVGGASSSISVSKVANATVPGFSQALQFGRAAANANTAPISLTQVIETSDSVRAQGHYLSLSFWATAGANFSGAALSVAVQTGNGTDQSLANLIAGSWTTQSYPSMVPGAASGTAGAAGLYGVGTAAQQPITASPVRYTFTSAAQLPANVTQLAVTLGYTPVGTAGANDWVQLAGIQLELGAAVSPFEHRDAQVELEIAQRYCWVTNEPAAGVIVATGGAVAAANAQVFYMAAPVQFRTAPTVTVVAGTFQVCAAAAAATATGLAAGATHTVNAISVNTTLTQTVGLAATLQGGGGAGTITASAEF